MQAPPSFVKPPLPPTNNVTPSLETAEESLPTQKVPLLNKIACSVPFVKKVKCLLPPLAPATVPILPLLLTVSKSNIVPSNPLEKPAEEADTQ